MKWAFLNVWAPRHEVQHVAAGEDAQGVRRHAASSRRLGGQDPESRRRGNRRQGAREGVRRREAALEVHRTDTQGEVLGPRLREELRQGPGDGAHGPASPWETQRPRTSSSRTARLYFTDLEQAVEDGDQAWDIAEFLYYAGKLSLKEDAMRVGRRTRSLTGTSRANGTENVAKAKASKYLAPFRPLVDPADPEGDKGLAREPRRRV